MYDSVITGRENASKEWNHMIRCLWRVLMSILCLFMHVLCVCALRLLSSFFWLFLGKSLAFLVKIGWQPCNKGVVHRCRSKQSFWDAKDFRPNFPKLSRKLQIFFSHKDHEDLSLVWPPKKKQTKTVFMCFSTNVGCHFLLEASEILPGFSEILPRFSKNHIFWGCACTPASYTTGS